jgi:hypothetical protein
MLIFAEGGKPEKNPRSKGENQQQTQLTYDAEYRNRTRGRSGERRARTPLRHPCFPYVLSLWQKPHVMPWFVFRSNRSLIGILHNNELRHTALVYKDAFQTKTGFSILWKIQSNWGNSSKIHNFPIKNQTSEILLMPVLDRKLSLQPIFDRIFHKMKNPILVWKAFKVVSLPYLRWLLLG